MSKYEPNTEQAMLSNYKDIAETDAAVRKELAIAPGQLVVGSNHGPVKLHNLNGPLQFMPMVFSSYLNRGYEIPEGVTLEGLVQGRLDPGEDDSIVVGAFNSYRYSELPSTIKFNSLTLGKHMFEDSLIKKINTDFPVMFNGDCMFRWSSITSFIGNTPKLLGARNMFLKVAPVFDCHFEGDLSSLTSADDMFLNYVLDKESVLNVVDTIKDCSTTSGTHAITISARDSDWSEQEKTELAARMTAKNWTVTWKWH